MKQIKYFINLTNGIEVLEGAELGSIFLEQINYIRIQSTHLEQGHFDRVLADLDYNLLMNLALGNFCVMFDYGSRYKDGVSRVLWQGIPWIEYVLCRRWFGKELTVNVKGHNCTKLFREHYCRLDEKVKRKLDYFKPFLLIKDPQEIKLLGHSNYTEHDGEKHFYGGILKVKFE